ncbi:hypothetical protein [Dokdonella sp.]|uniref:hypothetical protein n=1 Tax=Dokdonella sp. TaxID=2291710 RepID=UPI001B2F0DF6|nr:hypothetical protein [Dokdonella sp.]MBO9661505.1 hypothetical protein [Dokdonella sp.]
MPDGTRSGGGVQNQNDQGQNVDDGGTDNDGQNVNRQPSERDPENSKGDVTQRSGVRDTPRQEGRPPPSNPSNTGGPPINTGGPPVNNGGNIPRGNAFGVQNQMHPGQQMETLSGTLGGVIKTVGGVLDTTLEGVGRLLGGGNQLNPDTSSSRITPDDQGQNHQGPNGHNHGHPDTPRPIGAPAHSERTQPNLPGGPHNEGGPPSSNRANDGRPTTPMGGNEGASNPTSSRGGNVTELRTGQPQASPSSAQTSPSSQTSQPAQTQAQQATNRAATPMAQPVPLSGFVGTGQAAGVLAQATAQGALPSSIPGQLANLAAGAAGLLGQQTAEARQASTTATPQQLPAQNENAARDLRNSPTQLPQAPADAKRPPDMPADKALTKTPNEAQTQQQARTQNDAQTRPQTDLRTVNQQRPADAQQTLRTEGDAKALREGLEKTKLVQSAETARTSPLGEDAKKAAQLATNATGRAAAGTVESLRQALDWVGQQVRGVGADPKTDSEGVTAMRVVAGLVIAATVVGVAIAVLYAIRIAFVP